SIPAPTCAITCRGTSADPAWLWFRTNAPFSGAFVFVWGVCARWRARPMTCGFARVACSCGGGRSGVWVGEELAQLRGRGSAHRLFVDVRQRCLPQRQARQHGQLDRELPRAEGPGREVAAAAAIQAHPPAARLGGNAPLLEEARYRIRVLGVQVQGDRGVGVGGAFEHGADQARIEGGEELERPQRGFAAKTQRIGLVVALEQALVL